jgi:hypothetical protein
MLWWGQAEVRRGGELASVEFRGVNEGPDAPAPINHLIRRGGELMAYSLEVMELEVVVAPMGVDLGGQ